VIVRYYFGQFCSAANVVYVCMLQLLLGTKVGSVRVFDVREKKVIKDVVTDTTCPRYGIILVIVLYDCFCLYKVTHHSVA